jgi:hypothetical protein
MLPLSQDPAIWLLSMRRATDDDLLACNDMGGEGDSMLSLTLI